MGDSKNSLKDTCLTPNLVREFQRIDEADGLRTGAIWYLGVRTDSCFNFEVQVESSSAKAAAVGKTQFRLMANVRGSKQKRRALLTSVTTSVITYGISLWGDALATQSTRKKVTSVHRLSALRVASTFRSVSKDTAKVIFRLPPIGILAEERKQL